jgi:hypothetical protein
MRVGTWDTHKYEKEFDGKLGSSDVSEKPFITEKI